MSDNPKEDFFTEELRNAFSQFIGQSASSETVKKNIAEAVQNTVNEHPGVDKSEITYCGTLWNKMTVKEKLKWFAYNRFPFKRRGELERDIVWLKHHGNCLQWKLFNPDKDYSESPYRLQYPTYLESNPKQIIVTDVNIKLTQPIQYITMDLTIEGDKDG